MEEEGRELQLLGNVCVCVFVCLFACGEGGPGLLMYSHIMLGSDPAAVSKMFEAQNIISEKCSQRLAILLLERPDIWPFSFSPSPTSSPASRRLSWLQEDSGCYWGIVSTTLTVGALGRDVQGSLEAHLTNTCLCSGTFCENVVMVMSSRT